MNRLMTRTLSFTALFIALYLLLFIFFDQTVALYSKTLSGGMLYNIAEYISLLALGNIWNILLSLFLIAVMSYDYLHGTTETSKTILYILLSVMIATIIGTTLKYLLGRYRPIMLYKHHLYGFHYLATKWAENSSPSGHSYRIFALVGALFMVCRRWLWRWLFIIAGVCVGLSRIVVHAHYPSDVLFGAYIGILAAVWTRWYMYYR